MGWDGFLTLLFSLAIVTFSGGLTVLACWVFVIRIARLQTPGESAADVILVLGSRLDRGEMTRIFQGRLETALSLAEERPIMLLGGMARRGGPSEARVGRDWLVGRGFDPAQLIPEEISRNTLENLVEARRMMADNGYRRALIVTSRHHMARTTVIARGLGLPHELSPAAGPGPWSPAGIGRSLFEAMMINWYYSGQVLARLTGNRRMLARIT